MTTAVMVALVVVFVVACCSVANGNPETVPDQVDECRIKCAKRGCTGSEPLADSGRPDAPSCICSQCAQDNGMLIL